MHLGLAGSRAKGVAREDGSSDYDFIAIVKYPESAYLLGRIIGSEVYEGHFEGLG